MKKLLFSIIAMLACAFGSYASGFDVGMRNTRYVYGGYTFPVGVRVELSHSLFSEKLQFQSIGLMAGYSRSCGIVDLEGDVCGSTAWNGTYRTLAAIVNARVNPLRWLFFEGALSPHYDSGYGYTTCFSLQAGFNITSQISIMGGYTTIPEYRKSEKRLKGGIGFHVGNLYVEPNLSINVSGEQKVKNLRVLANFRYTF